jgi:aspartate/methionine/tyrosine aminotransferase
MTQKLASTLVSAVSAPPIAAAAEWLKERRSNRHLLNLSQAVPSYQPAPEMAEEVARLARQPETCLYTDIRGTWPLREALAAHMSEDYQGDVSPEQVTITAGCNQAFCAAIMALAERGDNVIMPSPYYFNHQMWLQMLGIELRLFPAFKDVNPFPDPADSEKLINERTRAIVLCSPNNPTGATYPTHLFRQFLDLAERRGIFLIVDETYKDFRSDPAPPHGLFSESRWPEHLVQLYSFSKAFAMTGYRVGSLIAGPRVQAQVEKILDCMAICAPAISQSAALFGLQALGDWKSAKVTMMAERRSALLTAFKHPMLSYRLATSGAYFAYVRHPFGGEPSAAVAKRLAQRHDVLCLPGSMFGPDQDAYLRLAFANVAAEEMPTLVDRFLESQA